MDIHDLLLLVLRLSITAANLNAPESRFILTRIK
jgi:hypothetical protein